MFTITPSIEYTTYLKLVYDELYKLGDRTKSINHSIVSSGLKNKWTPKRTAEHILDDLLSSNPRYEITNKNILLEEEISRLKAILSYNNIEFK